CRPWSAKIVLTWSLTSVSGPGALQGCRGIFVSGATTRTVGTCNAEVHPSLEGPSFSVGVERRAPEVQPLALLTDAREDVRTHEVVDPLPLDPEEVRCRLAIEPRVFLGPSADRFRNRCADTLLDERFERGRVDVEHERCLPESPASVTRRLSLRASPLWP